MGSGIKLQNERAEREAALAHERGPDEEQHRPDSDEEEGQASEPEPQEKETVQTSQPPLPQGEEPPPLPDEQPPLPNEAPPLPNEPPPRPIGAVGEDDGWDPLWDDSNQAFYFHNRFTGATQWENPRVPEAPAQPGPPGVESAHASAEPEARPHGGYNPAIHGDYDPTASYAMEATAAESQTVPTADATGSYAATGHFNRFTGRWQASDVTPDNYNDDAKSKRQMNAFFDVDAAANSHQGKSLKAERSGMKLTKAELKAFKEKRREKKEEKRRAWLRD